MSYSSSDYSIPGVVVVETSLGNPGEESPADTDAEEESPADTAAQIEEWLISIDTGDENPPETDAQVDKLVKSIQTQLRRATTDGETRPASPPTIHRVRPRLREEDPQAYDPRRVSIGPFHHGGDDDDLVEMGELKWRFMNDLLGRGPDHSVNKYVDAVRECASLARQQYSGDIGFELDEFVEMLVVDGCFLLECFVKCVLGHLRTELTSVNSHTKLIRNDAMLIENQIPFFVVEALFNVSTLNLQYFRQGSGALSLMELAAHFLKIKNMPLIMPEASGRTHHLLHLFHSSLDPKLSPSPPPKSWCQAVVHALGGPIKLISPIFYGVLYLLLMCRWPRLSSPSSTMGQRFPRTIPCATELRESGIRIKKRHFINEQEACLLKVCFQDGMLEIPLLSVDYHTNSLFRNLIAFEQHCSRVGSYFTSYAIFLDNLINTAADVSVLRSCGVMESKLGSDEEVAQLFNTICKGSRLDYQDHYLAPLFTNVNRYCQSSRHRWRAKLVHDYFGNPWAAISLVVAFLLLIFTGLQAVFSVLSYVHPP